MKHIIGIDPGPVVGAVLLRVLGEGMPWTEYEVEAAQITPNGLWALLDGWLDAYELDAVALERFVVGPRAGRSRTAQGGQAARDVHANVKRWVAVPGPTAGVRYIERSASEVKPWATDERLERVGLLAATVGMRHARDAARHALFCAVRDFGQPDPLSKRGRAA